MTVHCFLIDSPANAICAPHFSARSCHLGFTDSISNLLASYPALQLLLPRDCLAYIIEALVVNQTIAPVPVGKPLELTTLVLPNPPLNIVRDANIESLKYCTRYKPNTSCTAYAIAPSL